MTRAERQPPSYVSRRPVYTLSNLEIATVNRNLAVRTALSSLPSLWPSTR